jgi:hypothetical protein
VTGENSKEILYYFLQSRVAKAVGLGVGAKNKLPSAIVASAKGERTERFSEKSLRNELLRGPCEPEFKLKSVCQRRPMHVTDVLFEAQSSKFKLTVAMSHSKIYKNTPYPSFLASLLSTPL